jgi:hypothetical protein
MNLPTTIKPKPQRLLPDSGASGFSAVIALTGLAHHAGHLLAAVTPRISTIFSPCKAGTSQPCGASVQMADSAGYRAEALRFLKWAEQATDPAIARRWRRLADEYITLAEQLDATASGRPSILHAGRPQRQPVQQQQSKLEKDDPAEG